MAGLDNLHTLEDTELDTQGATDMEMDMETTTTVEDTIRSGHTVTTVTAHMAQGVKDSSTAVNSAVHFKVVPDINPTNEYPQDPVLQ